MNPNSYRVHAAIDLDAVVHNYLAFRNHIDSSTAICNVIKADGYGHGAIQLAKVLMEAGTDAFAVATAEEAIALREADINLPLLIFGYVHPDLYGTLIKMKVELTLFDLDTAKVLSETAEEMKQQALVHINIDTGMNRLGFYPDDDGAEAIKIITGLPGLSLKGIYTHFAKADEIDRCPTERQLQGFDEFLEWLKAVGIEVPVIHMANSAGAIEYESSYRSMVRIGIATYGLYPSEAVSKNQVKLKPVMSLKSQVIMVKTVAAGQPISYGGTFITDQVSRIATIPVGYADGYPRLLSNQGYVLIRGQQAPIVGRVCMDLHMVDVTSIEGVTEGDEVTLIGTDRDNAVTADELAKMTGTINYEITCGISKRVPRIYYKGGKIVTESANLNY